MSGYLAAHAGAWLALFSAASAGLVAHALQNTARRCSTPEVLVWEDRNVAPAGVTTGTDGGAGSC